MKKIVRLSLTLALAAVLTTGLFANGLNLNGFGARAAAMGGAFVGLANDYTAVYWNPAGLALLKQPTFGLTGDILCPRPPTRLGEYTMNDQVQDVPGRPARLLHADRREHRGRRRRLHPVRPRRGLGQHRPRGRARLALSAGRLHAHARAHDVGELHRLDHPGPLDRGQAQRHDLPRRDLQHQLRLLQDRPVGRPTWPSRRSRLRPAPSPRPCSSTSVSRP